MIPLDGMDTYIEKRAAPIGDSIAKLVGKGAKGLFNVVRRYPKTTIGVVGAGALATGVSDRVHDLYNILSEMRKRRTMKKEVIPTLKQIAQNTAPPPTEATPPEQQKLMVLPLT